MKKMFYKEKFINFRNRTVSLVNIIFAITILISSIYKGISSWFVVYFFLFILLFNLLYFVVKKRIFESTLFGFLIFLLIYYISK
ncbi:hypothetical protein SAMN02745912_01902 [Paramaledivibacter caminithermalis DSM 15212]|jgi:hypothetical protein|uniref:Uncharacterized protein n=1 Tax=Paramaledivibacter caminithermalis (strain DSM 15212 / CIP 107654 / DViRD3) TaxID=1121301 RepID=A0A1M6NV73_PARC5|nr:hypothetical protein SAMN02745912_01902 [Paramaledivibacter caminithermalis DSM 15212]